MIIALVRSGPNEPKPATACRLLAASGSFSCPSNCSGVCAFDPAPRPACRHQDEKCATNDLRQPSRIPDVIHRRACCKNSVNVEFDDSGIVMTRVMPRGVAPRRSAMTGSAPAGPGVPAGAVRRAVAAGSRTRTPAGVVAPRAPVAGATMLARATARMPRSRVMPRGVMPR